MHRAHAHTHSVLKSMRKWLQEHKGVRKAPNEPKLPNLPIGTKRDGLGNHVDVSTAWMDVQSDGNNPKTGRQDTKRKSLFSLSEERLATLWVGSITSPEEVNGQMVVEAGKVA